MDTKSRDILKMRAFAMAKEPEQKKDTSKIIELISFTMATETYGIETAFIREVYPLKDFTSLPGVPSYILGIINVRGKIIPVVDLKKFFNLDDHGLVEMNKVIILQDDQMEFGILADTVHGIHLLDIEEIKVVPLTVTGIGENYLKGVTKENLVVLNAEKLLQDKNIIVDDEVT